MNWLSTNFPPDPPLSRNPTYEKQPPTEELRIMDAKSTKGGMEGGGDPSANSGSMASLEKAKTGMEGGSNHSSNSGSVDARTPGRGMGRSEITVEPHRLEGVFVAKGEQVALCTENMVHGEAFYNEKLISVQNGDGREVEYRVWNPLRSNLAAAIIVGVEDIWIKRGLGAGYGRTVSHISDIVGPDGMVYAVENSPTKGFFLVNLAEKRANVVPILEDARHPVIYRALVPKVDVICCDIIEADRVNILALNAAYYLKGGGKFVMTNKSEYEDKLDVVCEEDMKKLSAEHLMHIHEIALHPYRPTNYASTVGYYRLRRNNVS